MAVAVSFRKDNGNRFSKLNQHHSRRSESSTRLPLAQRWENVDGAHDAETAYSKLLLTITRPVW